MTIISAVSRDLNYELQTKAIELNITIEMHDGTCPSNNCI